jgi:pimeloyl-ACP methyl ester carboxylesterase
MTPVALRRRTPRLPEPLVDGIHVTRWGASGPKVLLIHGGPQGGPAGGAQQWPAQRPLADQGWQLVLPDRPGHGQSPSRGPEDMEVDGEWAAEMVGALGRTHLVGHSYGGCVALVAAARRPQAVASLTLIEAPVFAAARYDPEVQAFRKKLGDVLTADLEPIQRLMAFVREVAVPRDPESPRPTPEQLAAMGAGLASMRHPTQWDGRIALETVARAHIPLLAVTGGWSPALEAIGEGLAAATGGEHRVVASGHHFPQMLAEPFNAQFAAFLSRTETIAAMEPGA